MDDKQPMQADGGDAAEQAIASRPGGTGESGGGAYPNPHTGKEDHPGDGFLGHGGQTDIGYHGSGQLGDQKVGGDENPNAGTRDD
jgi:hypothetical protein